MLEEFFKEKAKENKVIAGELYGKGLDSKVLQKSAKPIENIDTREELSKIAGVSHDTVNYH